ncbi:IS3 family transposase [uncultured Paenibacillus sp.]|uniref:IS3 family transposase n=1 Tax=uncultured Paenibacillus sp. TaxID=227322 RepID=UPI0028D8CB5A|nr:IS3 family transposase [uncultured Paenibacillus sp.]
MKDDLEYGSCGSIRELRARIDDYIAYYNSCRYQWGLKKMTPDEFTSHLLSA